MTVGGRSPSPEEDERSTLSSGPGPDRREFVVEVLLSADHREIGVGVHDAFSRLTTYRRLRVAREASGSP